MKRLLLGAIVSVWSFALAGPAPASAAAAGPAWGIDSVAYPSDFSSEDNARCEAQAANFALEVCDTYAVTAADIGSKSIPAAGATPVKIVDALPSGEGLSIRHVALLLEDVPGHQNQELGNMEFEGKQICTTSGLTATCELLPRFFEKTLLLHQILEPDQALKMFVSVTVAKSTPPTNELKNAVAVSGGIAGEAKASVTRQNTLEEPVASTFGPSLFAASFLGVDGSPDVQAGGHPYELDTRIGLASDVRETPEGATGTTSVHDVRDVLVDLPVGMAGSGVSAAQCTLARLASKGPKGEQGHSGCPQSAIIGHIRTYPESNASADNPVYNLVPEKGVAAELGFIDATGGTHVLYVGLAPTPSGYIVRTTSREIPQLDLTEILVNVFGDPAVRDGTGASTPPTLTNPSDCTGEPLQATVLMDSWQAPGSYNADGTPNLADPNWARTVSTAPAVTGCERLAGLFEPKLKAEPSDARADSPTGLDVNLEVPQRTGEEGQATPPLRDTTIALPEGMSVNPSSANGLQACSLEQVGIKQVGHEEYEPDAAPAHCPDASKVGTVELETPALAMKVCKRTDVPPQECPAEELERRPLTGSIYVAKQDEVFESLLAIFIVIEDPRTGVIVKLPAKVEANEETGQLTTTVKDSPQFPFSVLRTHFFAGAAAALSTPAMCGTYTVSSQLTPWSAPASGPPVTPSASFEVDRASDGGPCTASPFAPTFTASTPTPSAGAFGTLNVTFSRQDGEQDLAGATVTTPPGLLGIIRGIPRCPEPQASSGECSSASLLGEATTAVGAGEHPYWVQGGMVYLTGPYNGGPFGLSIVVPTTAGPYTLKGNAGPGREVVRASIRVDPHTAQITVVSDPLPTMLQGIPLQIRTVHVRIDRHSFIFNPTDCSALASNATFTSAQGATATASSSFYASGCANLPFHPTLTATTGAHVSKANGAGLSIRVTAGAGEAHIARTDLQLPVELPSRLETLQKACLAAQFAANPAGCPAASDIGTAIVETPVLNVPLTGPIYLVSFGGGEFPHTEIVLQGEGVTAVLDGHTDIKKGITYSNFETVPDVPFSSFVANLPEGPHSILGAHIPEALHNNLCGLLLTIPTLIAAQNGRQIKQAMPIHVTGCPTRPTIMSMARHGGHHRPATLTLTLYSPATGTLRIAGHAIQSRIVHVRQGANVVVTVKVAKRHPGHTTLSLTLRAMGRSQTTHVSVGL